MDPITNIEDAKAQHDWGVMGARVLAGAFEESESLTSALQVTAAFFEGMFSAALPEDPDQSDGGAA